MNFQSWGLEWFNNARNVYVTEPLIIITADGNKPLQGSVIEPSTSINFQGIRTPTDKTLFIFNTNDLVGISIRRGVRINRTRFGKLYEVILDRDTIAYANDPNKIETVVPGKEICS